MTQDIAIYPHVETNATRADKCIECMTVGWRNRLLYKIIRKEYRICIIGKNAKELGAACAAELNGRGGGKPEAFQGSLKATKAEITEFLQNHGF